MAEAGPSSADEESEISVHSEALVGRPSSQLWPNGIVPVCFHPKPLDAVSTPEFAAQTALIRSALEYWYESIPDAQIDLQGFGLCPDMTVGSLPGQVRVVVSVFGGSQCDEPNPPEGQCNFFTRYCPLGTDVNDAGSCKLSHTLSNEALVFTRGLAYSWPDGFAAGVLHEFGHVIARAPHEQDREDVVGSCGAGNETPLTDDFLTTYDGGESTMSATYCHWTPALSPRDQLGLEMLYYAGSFDQGIGAWSGLRVGSSVLMRDDDAVITEWTFRGAHDTAYPDSVRWTAPVGRTSVSLPASLLPSDTPTAITATFNDVFDREHSASGSVRVNTNLHTAILLQLI